MDRLNKTANRRRADRVGIDGKAVADLERAAVVIPFGDKAEGQLLHIVSGTAQGQAHKGGQAQVQAARPARQVLWMLCFEDWTEGGACFGRKLERPPNQIRNTETGKWA